MCAANAWWPNAYRSFSRRGFGVTVKAVDDRANRLNVALGGSLFSQQLTPGSVAKVSRAFPAARAAFDYRRKLTDLAYVQQTAEYLPALGDTAASYFVNTESAVVAPLSKSVGLCRRYKKNIFGLDISMYHAV